MVKNIIAILLALLFCGDSWGVIRGSGGSDTTNIAVDAQVRFAANTTEIGFEVRLYDASYNLLATSNQGTAVANSIVTVTFPVPVELIDGVSYSRAIRSLDYVIYMGASTVTGVGLYKDTSISDPLDGVWQASNYSFDIAIRNSEGTVLLGQTTGSLAHAGLDWTTVIYYNTPTEY